MIQPSDHLASESRRVMDQPAASYPQPDRPSLPSENERIILDIVRRQGRVPRSAITARTNLTQQSVHRIIDSLLERGLLLLGDPVIQGRGKPSPVVCLNPEARFSVGISINTDSATFCVTDFACAILHEEVLDLVPHNRAETLDLLQMRIGAELARRDIGHDRLVGVGFAMSGFFVRKARYFNPPTPLADWAIVDVATQVAQLLRTLVWTENNATTGAIGESVIGAGLTYPTFGYLSFNYGFGGGVVLDGKPFLGSFGNAGEISRVYTADEGPSRPALGNLLRRLQANGIQIQTISALRREFDPTWPGVAAWVEDVGPFLNRAIDAMRGVIDPAAIVFGGELPARLGELLLALPPSPEIVRHGHSADYPIKLQSQIPGDQAVLGAALIPLKNQYYL